MREEQTFQRIHAITVSPLMFERIKNIDEFIEKQFNEACFDQSHFQIADYVLEPLREIERLVKERLYYVETKIIHEENKMLKFASTSKALKEERECLIFLKKIIDSYTKMYEQMKEQPK